MLRSTIIILVAHPVFGAMVPCWFGSLKQCTLAGDLRIEWEGVHLTLTAGDIENGCQNLYRAKGNFDGIICEDEVEEKDCNKCLTSRAIRHITQQTEITNKRWTTHSIVTARHKVECNSFVVVGVLSMSLLLGLCFSAFLFVITKKDYSLSIHIVLIPSIVSFLLIAVLLLCSCLVH